MSGALITFVHQQNQSMSAMKITMRALDYIQFTMIYFGQNNLNKILYRHAGQPDGLSGTFGTNKDLGANCERPNNCNTPKGIQGTITDIWVSGQGLLNMITIL